MTYLGHIIVDRPAAFGTFEHLKAALRHVKDLGYGGVELNLAKPLGFKVAALHDYVGSLGLPIVSFLTGTTYFSEGLCLSSPVSTCDSAPWSG